MSVNLVGEHITMFHVPVAKYNLSKVLNLNNIEKYFYDYIAHFTNHRRVYSNNGGVQTIDINVNDFKVLSEDHFVTINEMYGFLNSLTTQSCKKLFFNNCNDRDKLIANISNFWCNVNKRGDYNEVHTHPGSVIVAVLYLSVPDNSGKIKFISNSELGMYVNRLDNIRHTDLKTAIFLNDYGSITPTNGDFIVFPGYLKHFVEPNLSIKDRVTIAFNFNIKV